MKVKYIFLSLILLILILINIKIGFLNISFAELFGFHYSENQNIITMRWNKVFSIILGGISISISGFLLQEMLKNPLAGPSVLGISTSAGLGVAIALFLGIFKYFSDIQDWLYPLFGMIGSFSTLLIILIFYQKFNTSYSFIIFGFLISGFSSSIINLLQYYAPSESIKQYLIWSLGSFTSLSTNQNIIFLLLTIIGLIISGFATQLLRGNLLGEKYAMSLGGRYKKNVQVNNFFNSNFNRNSNFVFRSDSFFRNYHTTFL